MATIKIALDKRRVKDDETYPVILRITQNQKSTSISTGISVKDKEWNEATREVRKSHPNHTLLNQKIRKHLATIEARLLSLEITNQPFQRKAIVNGAEKTPTETPDFFTYGQSWVERQIKAGKIGNAAAYRYSLSALKSYLGHERLKFTDINYNFLEDFQAAYLNKGTKQNTISYYLRTIRTIFNKAVKAKVIDKSVYPFEEFNVKYESTAKRAVSNETILQIEKVELLEGSPAWHNRNYFMLSFYLIGMSFIDLCNLKPSDIKDGRVMYKRKKTGKIYNIKLTEKATSVLGYYLNRPTKSPYILPVIPERVIGDKEKEWYWASEGFKYCNRHLKKIAVKCGIKDNISTYVARHSWATIARSLGYSKDMIAEALGHEYGNKVTGIYLDHYSNDVIDAMNERVTG